MRRNFHSPLTITHDTVSPLIITYVTVSPLIISYVTVNLLIISYDTDSQLIITYVTVCLKAAIADLGTVGNCVQTRLVLQG